MFTGTNGNLSLIGTIQFFLSYVLLLLLWLVVKMSKYNIVRLGYWQAAADVFHLFEV